MPTTRRLIDRAERRLKNLNYFKTVKISAKPARCRTASCSMSSWRSSRPATSTLPAATRPTDGLARRGQAGRPQFLGNRRGGQIGSVTYGQYARGIDLSAIRAVFPRHPGLGGHRALSPGRTNSSPYQSYGSDIYGATLQFGTPLTEQLGVQYRYSLYNQNVTFDPTSPAAAPSLPVQQAAAGRSAMGLLGRQHRQLQYAGQHQEPDQRI